MSQTITMNVALTDALKSFVSARIASGAYGNASEYVRDLIRRDQDAQHHQALKALLREGLASGPAAPLGAQDWDELDAVARGDIA